MTAVGLYACTVCALCTTVQVYKTRDGSEIAVVAATWELNRKISFESLQPELKRNAAKFWRNFGSKVGGEAAGTAIRDSSLILANCNLRRADPWDYSKNTLLPWVRGRHKTRYFMHFDLAKNGDKAGVCVAHLEPSGVAVCDFLHAVAALPGRNIDFEGLRDLVFLFHSRGFVIELVTYDQWQCLSVDTLVNTDRGLIPLSDVRPGDLVHSRVGPRMVEHRFDFGVCPTLRIETTDGDVLEGTAQHRIEALSHWEWVKGKRRPVWEWKQLDALAPNDVVRMVGPVDLDAPNVMLDQTVFTATRSRRPAFLSEWQPPHSVTEHFAEWLGLIWGDGDLHRDGVRLTVTPDEALDACQIFGRLFGTATDFRDEGKHGTTAVWSRPFRRWLAANEFEKPLIPPPIMESSRTVKAAFLRGLFAADGNIDKNEGRVSLETKHYQLAQQVRILLRTEFGFESTLVRRHRGVAQGRYTEGLSYVVSIRGSRSGFADRIDFSYRRKRDELQVHQSRRGRTIFTRVKRITPSVARVVDLQVADDPSYVANGFMSHNSEDSRQQLEKKNFKTDYRSADKTPAPYDTLIEMLIAGRLDYYNHPLFLREMKALRTNGIKYDHAKNGSKDVSDAAACAVWTAIHYELENPTEAPGTVRVIRQGKRSRFNNRYGEKSMW